ncbi:uncharacterized protein LOC130641977 [Hydractinia symbiolongicarpus]|uniref:uncharacterized protein LOC130641977 n=1 Tax=Hydractinia symbiolongicarpus TaxID=13093 RepID=UPI00254ADCAF|nr:uncharacterized protein LOC130641977 [Hydractinia symbiolongicarpus]
MGVVARVGRSTLVFRDLCHDFDKFPDVSTGVLCVKMLIKKQQFQSIILFVIKLTVYIVYNKVWSSRSFNTTSPNKSISINVSAKRYNRSIWFKSSDFKIFAK